MINLKAASFRNNIYDAQCKLYGFQNNVMKNYSFLGRILGIPITMGNIILKIVGSVGAIFENFTKCIINWAIAPFSSSKYHWRNGRNQFFEGSIQVVYLAVFPLIAAGDILYDPAKSLFNKKFSASKIDTIKSDQYSIESRWRG